MSDILAISLVAIIVAVALWRLIRSFRRKDGGGCGCGGCGTHRDGRG